MSIAVRGNARPAGGRTLRRLPAGVSVVDLTLAMGVIAITAALSAPVVASSIDSGRARQAAQFLSAQCRGARMEAVAKSAASAVVFDLVNGRWRLQRCLDGNGNGVRRTDIKGGRDLCSGTAVDLGDLFAGVVIAVDAALPDPDGGPGSADPVRLGASNLVSFAPAGTATAGTVYLRSAGGAQYAVRVAGVTGRVRILHYDTSRRQWVEA